MKNKPPTILIVDDNPEIREILDKYILSPAGYHVLTAADGRSGIARAIQESPDLILLDINLPDTQGQEVLRILQQLDKHFDVIFVTADDSLTIAIEALRLGVRDYLLKPFHPANVLSMVQRVLHQRDAEARARKMSQELVAAEAIRKTAVTLAHHINNDLMALGGNLVLLRDMLREAGNQEALTLVYESLKSARNINSALRHLQKTTSTDTETYDQHTEMVHITTKPHNR